jgi:hypothetical protein
MSKRTSKINNATKDKIIADIADRVNFGIQVIYVLRDTDYKKIENLMRPESHSSLTKEQREKEVLEQALLSFSLNNLDESCFEYLIFEYKISEDVYPKLNSEHKTKIVENMFDKRRLNEELSAELASNAESKLKIKI